MDRFLNGTLHGGHLKRNYVVHKCSAVEGKGVKTLST